MTLDEIEREAREIERSRYHGPTIDDPDNKEDLASPAWHLARYVLAMLPVVRAAEVWRHVGPREHGESVRSLMLAIDTMRAALGGDRG